MQASNRLKSYFKNSSVTLEELIDNAKTLILYNTPLELHNRILEKIKNLKFDISEYGTSSEYKFEKNTIYINTASVHDVNIYLHEMMHAIGSNQNKTHLSIGLSKKFQFKIDKNNMLLLNLGYGANEGLNQHYTEKFSIFEKYSTVSPEYSFVANVMGNLVNLLPENLAKKAHFSAHGLDMLIHGVVKKCHLPNENKILKLILQLDAYKTIARVNIVFGATYSTDARFALLECYKTLISIAITKAKAEYKYINFDEAINTEHLVDDNLAYFNKYMINDLKEYYEKEMRHIYYSLPSGYEGVTYKKLIENTYKIYKHYIKNRTFNGNFIPEQLKCGEFYNFILLNGVIADELGESKLIETNDFQRDLTIATFKPKNHMLPEHKKEMAQLVLQFLTSRNVVRCGVEIQDDYIYKATENEDFNIYLMESIPHYYRQIFANVDYKAKSNYKLVEKMLSEVFLQKSALYKFKELMPKEILNRKDIKMLLDKYKVDEKLEIDKNLSK